jgi:hypothetical protein
MACKTRDSRGLRGSFKYLSNGNYGNLEVAFQYSKVIDYKLILQVTLEKISIDPLRVDQS